VTAAAIAAAFTAATVSKNTPRGETNTEKFRRLESERKQQKLLEEQNKLLRQQNANAERARKDAEMRAALDRSRARDAELAWRAEAVRAENRRKTEESIRREQEARDARRRANLNKKK